MAIDLNILHGPPEIGGVLFPMCQFETPVEGVLDDSDSRQKTMENGTIITTAIRRRRRWVMGFKGMDTATYQLLVDILETKTGFTFKPRTISTAHGDVAPELSYTCRHVGSLPVTRKANLETWGVEMDLETVGWFT